MADLALEVTKVVLSDYIPVCGELLWIDIFTTICSFFTMSSILETVVVLTIWMPTKDEEDALTMLSLRDIGENINAAGAWTASKADQSLAASATVLLERKYAFRTQHAAKLNAKQEEIHCRFYPDDAPRTGGKGMATPAKQRSGASSWRALKRVSNDSLKALKVMGAPSSPASKKTPKSTSRSLSLPASLVPSSLSFPASLVPSFRSAPRPTSEEPAPAPPPQETSSVAGPTARHAPPRSSPRLGASATRLGASATYSYVGSSAVNGGSTSSATPPSIARPGDGPRVGLPR